ncbi:MAG TPA: TetR/AcrR family transcriptional regulator [Nevskiaceae bacterium]|nr:TetR/AcrR family transcriptional regulator [Nevskiaceae bacterium]
MLALDELENQGYEKGRATRRRLVEVASTEFARHGFAATSVERIAVAAQMNKGAVTGHFKLKRDLYIACLKYTLRFLAELDEIDPKLSAQEGLLRFIRRLGANLSENPNARALLIQLQRDADDAVRSEMVGALLTEPFRQLRRHIEKVNPRLDSAAYAFLIFSQLLLDPDQHWVYKAMARDAVRTHRLETTVRRLASIIRTARDVEPQAAARSSRPMLRRKK